MKTMELMPEVTPFLEQLYESGMMELEPTEYLVDVKIHMLMPNMWPCIPNWHRDFVPRDMNLKRDFKKISGEKMYSWLSGPPFTEYRREDGSKYLMEANEWHAFTQDDLHRGTMCTEHTWRCFIRVIPAKFVHPTTINKGQLRQHIQTYLDVNKFTW